MDKIVTASILVIGNEILSGRTQDININYIAKELNLLGIKLTNARIIQDDEIEIIKNINEMRSNSDYLFTTGGIGPTHDDLTSLAVAKAFSVELSINDEAFKILKEYYGGELNESRTRMALIPQKAQLIYNSITKAPGYFIENVYVFAGVPKIFQAMFNEVKGRLKRGATIYEKSIQVYLGEGLIAQDLSNLQKKWPNVIMGSYPFKREQLIGTELILSSSILDELEKAFLELKNIISKIENSK